MHKPCTNLPFRVPQVLVQMRNVDYIAALAIENADLGILAQVPPPIREKEKHGNAKRKRKVMFVQRSCNMYIIGYSLSCRRRRARQGTRRITNLTYKKTEEARAQRACANVKRQDA